VTLPPELEAFADAITIGLAVPDATTRRWYPEGHPAGLRVPFAASHVHPVVKVALGGPQHWDGAVPRYPWVRLALEHPAVAHLAAALRSIARDAIGPDGALYVYVLAHRSEHHRRTEAFERLAALLRAATEHAG
jgi:hypothetical protein